MMKSANYLLRSLTLAIAGLGIAVIAGCAGVSNEVASGKISAAEKAIDVARQGAAPTYASTDLKMALDKLNTAKAAQVNEDYNEAAKMADEAAADADYARSKAATEKTRKTVSEVQENIGVLRKEIETSP